MRTMSIWLSLIALTLLPATAEARGAAVVAVRPPAPIAAPRTPGQSPCTALAPAECLAAGLYPAGAAALAPGVAALKQKTRHRQLRRTTIETVAGVTVVRGPGSHHLSP